LKEVIFLITEAYDELSQTTIQSGFKQLMEFNLSILNMPDNHFEDEDDISLTTLFRRLLPETTMSDKEIMDWAKGRNENSRSLISDDEILVQVADMDANVEEDEDSRAVNVNDTVNCMDIIID
jgi:hypothetical protein